MSLKRNNVSEIKRLVHERKEASSLLLRFLIAKGISPSVAEEIMAFQTAEGKTVGNIKDIVASKLRVAGDLNFAKPQRLLFVGPTGVGKTAVIQKLALYYAQLQKKVAVMSLDGSKKEHLKGWADANGIPLTETNESKYDLILIDTEGCNYYLQGRVEALGEQIGAINEDFEIVLTLSAAAKEVDLYGAVHQFSILSPKTVAFTKLDETLSSGVLLNVCAKSDLPIRYIAHGFPLPGVVQVADPQEITHKILTEFNKKEFQLLRQMTLAIN